MKSTNYFHRSIILLTLLILFLSGQSFILRSSMIAKKSLSMNRLMMQSQEQLGRVTMYKKEGCPYCSKAKTLLQEKYQLNVTYVDVESANRYFYFISKDMIELLI